MFLIIVITILIGGIFAFFSTDSMKEYKNLIQPALSPPGFLFPIIWTILFILMGISYYIITESYSNNKYGAYTIYFIQLIVNSFWTLFFFILNWRLFSFLWILFLIVLVIIMIIRFYRINKISAYLQIPYLIWLIFAAYLNLAIYIING